MWLSTESHAGLRVGEADGGRSGMSDHSYGYNGALNEPRPVVVWVWCCDVKQWCSPSPKGSVAELAERQPSSGVTGVRSLPAAPSRCGRVTSVLSSLVG